MTKSTRYPARLGLCYHATSLLLFSVPNHGLCRHASASVGRRHRSRTQVYPIGSDGSPVLPATATSAILLVYAIGIGFLVVLFVTLNVLERYSPPERTALQPRSRRHVANEKFHGYEAV